MNRARRSVVAERASSKQHSAKLSNCLVKVALIARKQRRRIEEVPSDRTRAARVKPERTLMRSHILNNCSHTRSATYLQQRAESRRKAEERKREADAEHERQKQWALNTSAV